MNTFVVTIKVRHLNCAQQRSHHLTVQPHHLINALFVQMLRGWMGLVD